MSVDWAPLLAGIAAVVAVGAGMVLLARSRSKLTDGPWQWVLALLAAIVVATASYAIDALDL